MSGGGRSWRSRCLHRAVWRAARGRRWWRALRCERLRASGEWYPESCCGLFLCGVKGEDCGFCHGLEGDSVLAGGAAAILVLGHGVALLACGARHFDADLSVGRVHGDEGALEDGALLGAAADAEGGGLAEEQGFEGCNVFG